MKLWVCLKLCISPNKGAFLWEKMMIYQWTLFSNTLICDFGGQFPNNNISSYCKSKIDLKHNGTGELQILWVVSNIYIYTYILYKHLC